MWNEAKTTEMLNCEHVRIRGTSGTRQKKQTLRTIYLRIFPFKKIAEKRVNYFTDNWKYLMDDCTQSSCYAWSNSNAQSFLKLILLDGY